MEWEVQTTALLLLTGREGTRTTRIPDTDTDTDTESKVEGNFLKEENKKEYIDPNQIVDSS